MTAGYLGPSSFETGNFWLQHTANFSSVFESGSPYVVQSELETLHFPVFQKMRLAFHAASGQDFCISIIFNFEKSPLMRWLLCCTSVTVYLGYWNFGFLLLLSWEDYNIHISLTIPWITIQTVKCFWVSLDWNGDLECQAPLKELKHYCSLNESVYLPFPDTS